MKRKVFKYNARDDDALNYVFLRVFLLLFERHAGFASTGEGKRCVVRLRWGGGQTDARDESRQAETERKRYETAVPVLWRQVSVYRSIRTRRVIPCRSYVPFLNRGAHPALRMSCHRHVVNLTERKSCMYICDDYILSQIQNL